jgi:hypothetical protein
LPFSQRTPMRQREPIVTNADESAMNFEGVCVLFSELFSSWGELAESRAADVRRAGPSLWLISRTF